LEASAIKGTSRSSERRSTITPSLIGAGGSSLTASS
jgi:hypothetical protein